MIPLLLAARTSAAGKRQELVAETTEKHRNARKKNCHSARFRAFLFVSVFKKAEVTALRQIPVDLLDASPAQPERPAYFTAIPSFCMRERNVLAFTPNIAAAPLGP